MICLDVDLSNPGQFFGCCGIFELAQRLWPEATAHFEGTRFVVSRGDLDELVQHTVQAPLEVLDRTKETSSPLKLGGPFDLRLDWWQFEPGLKTWAGQMSVARIAAGLRDELPNALKRGFFDHADIVIDADGKKVEPFCFDGRRGATALPLDVGFSTDALSMTTVAYSATEFFTLVGLQRFRPREAQRRVYQYRAWHAPLSAALAALALANTIADSGPRFQFESALRSKYLKAFTPAVPLPGDRHD